MSAASNGALLRCTAPGLRLNLPDTIELSERIRKSTRPNDGLVFNHYSKSPGALAE